MNLDFSGNVMRCALGRSLDWGLWAGGAKWCVSGMFPEDRRMLRVGCPRGILLFASIKLQTIQRRCPNAGGHSLAASKKVFGAARAEARRPVMLACCCFACHGGLWEALGLGLVGGGCEMGRFGHVFEQPSHVEGGLSAWDLALRVDQPPNITKEVPECGWP